MKLKKILTLILTFMIVLSSGSIYMASADGNLEELLNLGIAPDSVTEANLNEYITREQFAFMAAHLLSLDDLTPMDTRFSDVKKDNPYSGYIEFLAASGIINGETTGLFNPRGKTPAVQGYKILIDILGYGQIAKENGGYPKGYEQLALNVGLTKNVSVASDGLLTNKAAITLVYNALMTEFADVAYLERNGDLYAETVTGSGYTLLAKNLGISVYTGYITDVNQKALSVRFQVEKNKYDTNPNMLKNGENINLTVARTVDVNKFENVPATIWVDSNDNMIFIEPQRNVEIRYVHIDSVNGDKNRDSSYSASYIEELAFIDDEDVYDVAEDVKLKYNGVETTASVNLNNRLSKIVLVNDEIVYIESWDFAEGGLVTAKTVNDITYTKGDKKLQKIKDVSAYERVYVFIDGRSADYKEIKPNSVFDYYAAEDFIAISVSEKIIADELENVSAMYLGIGGSQYKKDKLYVSVDGVNYKETNDLTKLLSANVLAHLAPNGNVLYIEKDTKESSNYTEFYGIVNGVQTDSMDDYVAQIELWLVEPTVKKQIFNINERTVFDGVGGISELKANSKNLSGKGFYRFEANAKGDIKKVLKPESFFGLDGKYACPSTFADSATPIINVDGKPFYFNIGKFTMIYEVNGEFTVKRVPWSSLNYKYTTKSNALMSFYGEGRNPKPAHIVITGDLCNLANGGQKSGIVIGRMKTIDEFGNYCTALNVAQGASVFEYKVSDKVAETIPEYAFIRYYDGLIFSQYDIDISEVVDLTGHATEWQESISLVKGTVDVIGENVVFFENGDFYAIDGRVNFFAQVEENGNPNRRFSTIDISEIEKGDTVFVIKSANIASGIIVYKD